MDKIILIGGSGFIGKGLQKKLSGTELTLIGGRNVMELSAFQLSKKFEDQDIIINLAGQSIFGYWTKAYKRKLWNSRVDLTNRIYEALKLAKKKPKRFLTASAIGLYDDGGVHDENSERFADNDLSKLVQNWEKASDEIKKTGIDVTFLRIGIVMGKGGGTYKKLRLLTRLNLGAYFGKGNQSMSFIYYHDLLRAIVFVIDKNINGVVNMVAPGFTNNKELMLSLKKKLNSFVLWRIPAFIIKVFMGEASIILLEGQKVSPAVLQKHGFNFEAQNIEELLEKVESS